MKKILIGIAVISSTGAALAQDYMSVGVEAVSAKYSNYEFVNPRITGMVRDNDTPTVMNLNVAYGRQYSGFRGEVELVLGSKAEFTSYHSPFNANAQTKEVTSNRLMANFYKDFELAYSVKPFVAGSIGVAYNSAEGFQGANRDPFEKKSAFALAYGTSIGARYSLDKSSNLSLAYQYVNAGKANTGISQFAPRDEQFKGKLVTNGLKLAYTKSF